MGQKNALASHLFSSLTRGVAMGRIVQTSVVGLRKCQHFSCAGSICLKYASTWHCHWRAVCMRASGTCHGCGWHTVQHCVPQLASPPSSRKSKETQKWHVAWWHHWQTSDFDITTKDPGCWAPHWEMPSLTMPLSLTPSFNWLRTWASMLHTGAVSWNRVSWHHGCTLF